MNNSLQKILVIQTAFTGDVILATALLESIHQQHPDIQIDVLVRKGNEGLFHQHPFLKNCLVWDKKSSKWSNLFKLIDTIRKNQYDAVLNLQRYFSSGLLTILSGAAIKVGYAKNPLSLFFTKKLPHEFNGQHETSRNHSLLKCLGEFPTSTPKLYPSPSDKQAIEEITKSNKNYIVIAPASVWFTKQLPVDKWCELIDETPHDLAVFIIGAPGDKALQEEIINASHHPKLIGLCGKLSLLQSAELIKNARMNYVNDSAPLHLCSAMNAPVTAFFCSTVPEFGFGPLSSQSSIVEAQPRPNCKPCGIHGFRSCPQQHFNCAREINVKSSALKSIS
jgi:ADP-heptose:LPS heptosyltransferase